MTANRAPNSLLREAITATGWTYEALAAAVRQVAAESGETLRTNKSAVAHWVDGAQPSGHTAHHIAEAFSRRAGRLVTPVEIGLRPAREPLRLALADPVSDAIELGRSDLDRRGFLAVAAFTTAGVAMPLRYDHEAVARLLRARTGSSRIGSVEVEVVREITSAFGAADERLGGGHGLTTVTAYLADTAAPMLRGRFATEAIRRAAFGAVAELAYLAGWKHHDLGHEGTSQRYYQIGYQLAFEADPHGHAAWMMRALAHQALSLRQPHHCVDLIEHALARGLGHVDSRTEALLRITHARAYAATGERPAAAKALLAAENALTRGGDEQARYSLATGPAAGTVASHTARTLTGLADHTGTEHLHREALLRWDPTKYRRVHVLTHADLGDSLAAQARADEAIDAWTHALTLSEGMASDRAREAVAAMRPILAVYRGRGVPGAADLEQRIRDALG
ncbi:tetratricopeptide repeat protein [Embleya sp. NPDC055664]